MRGSKDGRNIQLRASERFQSGLIRLFGHKRFDDILYAYRQMTTELKK